MKTNTKTLFVTAIIGLVLGFLIGIRVERKVQEQKSFLFQKEINKIG
jgi:uncharacterized membrane-anchored protein YhcB (DUF1043 family)